MLISRTVGVNYSFSLGSEIINTTTNNYAVETRPVTTPFFELRFSDATSNHVMPLKIVSKSWRVYKILYFEKYFQWVCRGSFQMKFIFKKNKCSYSLKVIFCLKRGIDGLFIILTPKMFFIKINTASLPQCPRRSKGFSSLIA